MSPMTTEIIGVSTQLDFTSTATTLKLGDEVIMLPAKATLHDLIAALGQKGFNVDCPLRRQEGKRYPALIYLDSPLERLTPRFTIDLDCRYRLSVSVPRKQDAEPADMFSRFMLTLEEPECDLFAYAALPNCVLDLASIRSFVNRIPHLDCDTFNARPQKDHLYHCLYSLKHHLLPYRLNDTVFKRLVEVTRKMEDVIILRAVDRLSKKQQQEMAAFVKETVELAEVCLRQHRARESSAAPTETEAKASLSEPPSSLDSQIDEVTRELSETRISHTASPVDETTPLLKPERIKIGFTSG